MKFIYTHTAPDKANAILKNRYVQIIPAPAKHNMPYVEAADLSSAIAALDAKPYTHPAPVSVSKSLTKRELVDKLIDLGIASKFNDLLGTLPLEEKLRWEASSIISPDYPFIKNGRAHLCAELGITEEQLDNIFK